MATFALQNIHFSNVRLWRKADIGGMTVFDPKGTISPSAKSNLDTTDHCAARA